MVNEFDREDYVVFLLSEWGDPHHPSPYYADRMKFITKLIRGKTVLDAGCGIGHFMVEVEKQYGNTKTYVGLDISTAMLNKAREYLPKGNFIRGDITTFNIMADTIVCVDVLIHQEDLTPFINNMWKNAKKEIIFSMNVYDDFLGRRAHDGPIYFSEGLIMHRTKKVRSILEDLKQLGGIEEHIYDELTSVFRVTKNE